MLPRHIRRDRRTVTPAFLAAATAAILAASCGEPSGPKAGPAAQLLIVSGNAQSNYAGQELPQPLIVKVVDSSGQAVAGQLVNFVVTQGGGSVFAGAAITNDTGVAQERWTLGNVGPNALEARAVDAGSGAPIVFATFTAQAVTRARAVAKVAGDSQTATVNTAVATDLSVRVTDGAGPVAGAQVTFRVFGSPRGTVTDSIRVTDAGGVATVGSWIMSQTAGTNSLAASTRIFADSVDETGVAFTGTAVAGPATALTVDSADNHRYGIVTRPMYYPVRVRARDAFGNPVSGVAVSFSAGQGGSVPAGAVTTDGSGAATTSWTLGPGAGIQVVTATAAGLTSTADTGHALAFSQLAGSRVTTCGVTTAGTLYCWGSTGNQGDWSIDSLFAVRAYGPGVAEIAMRNDMNPPWGQNCARMVSGAGVCWSAFFMSPIQPLAPVTMPGGRTFVSVSVAGRSMCGLTADDSVFCWYAGYAWQLAGGTIFTQVSGGRCGLAGNGTAYCWNPQDSTSVPAPVGGPALALLSVATDHACGLDSAGLAYCWGGAFPANPTGLPGGPFISLAAGGLAGTEHVCALAAGGSAYCMGRNFRGQLGDGTNTDRTSFTPVAGGLVFASIAAGPYNSCGITTAGVPYCWGYNATGAVGDGTRTDRWTPTPVIVR